MTLLSAKGPAVRSSFVSPEPEDGRRALKGRRLWCGLALATLATLSQETGAQVWRIQPSIAAEVDVTNNVNLDTGAARRTDIITEFTPAVIFSERGAHSSVTGTVSAPVLLYARTGSRNNSVRPQAAITGFAELVPRLFFIDASASVSQQYISPFGPRPGDLVSVTSNRVTAQSYTVSPYLKGEASDGLSYELRDNNTWTIANGIAATGNRAYTNDIVGHVTREPRPFGWALDYDRTDTRFSGRDPLVTEAERGRLTWRPDPQWQVGAIAGYENDRYPLATYASGLYGVETKWRPNDRTNVDATYEHRFFGASYHVSIDHRMPLSVWSLRAFRDISTFPQQLAALPAGVDVNSLLARLFSTRIPDPVERQTAVDQLIRDRGLPSVLSSPLSLFTQQVTLQESVQGTFGLLGARNTVFFTAFRTRSEPITSAVPGAFDLLIVQTDNTQTGANVVWTHNLTTLYTLSTSVDWSRAIANDGSGLHSNQGSVRIALSAPLSPLTQAFAGARYQRLSSDAGSGYRAAGAFVGVNHVFR